MGFCETLTCFGCAQVGSGTHLVSTTSGVAGLSKLGSGQTQPLNVLLLAVSVLWHITQWSGLLRRPSALWKPSVCSWQSRHWFTSTTPDAVALT